MKKPTCKTCVYWDDFEYDDTIRKCILRPLQVDYDGYVVFGKSARNQTCGEYIDKVTFKTFLECVRGDKK